MAGGQQQHVEFHRKLKLRHDLLDYAGPGAAYVPYCGDGDLAEALYLDRAVYAADLDQMRVLTARVRLPEARVRYADCDRWPFWDIDDAFSVADLDSYSYPYHSMRAFLANAILETPLVIFGTDGGRMAVSRAGAGLLPDGGRFQLEGLERTRTHRQWPKLIEEYVRRAVDPLTVTNYQSYQRKAMIYWGAVVA